MTAASIEMVLRDCGAAPGDAGAIVRALGDMQDRSAGERWSYVSRTCLRPEVPFAAHLAVYHHVFAGVDGPWPAWSPDPRETAATNISAVCHARGLPDYAALRAWSIEPGAAFWEDAAARLRIRFHKPPHAVVDLSRGVEHPLWFAGARMNIAESCFTAQADHVAVVHQREGGEPARVTLAELDFLSARVAASLADIGVGPGDAVAIAMPMTLEAVAAYIGIVRMGAVVVSVADSFSAPEIATRLRIAGATVVITQDVIARAGKILPMYEKVVEAGARTIVVILAGDTPALSIREEDRLWSAFLSETPHPDMRDCDPGDTTNILFSSGTTGDPKAIPWSHTTPIKCAADGFYHHDIHAGDVVCWPTNLGWMMGPWLIYAALVNGAAIALYEGAPNTRAFCEFVRDAGVTMLGVVPSLVGAWRAAAMTEGIDWSKIRAFSSTGEASNAEDMLWLMARAGYKPVVEYCGGTEIGGGYLTQALVQPASPATFSTPALGLAIHILDENGQPVSNGELFLEPPSIGLSTALLNRDHNNVYYHDTPRGPEGQRLRRHGDQIERLPGGFFRAHGRADDTMNLGGIKVSSAEIERALREVEGIVETAAIAVAPEGGGPSRLLIYAVVESEASRDASVLRTSMQRALSVSLNPLFRVHDVIVVDALPRTASNKVMRRVLRDRYGG